MSPFPLKPRARTVGLALAAVVLGSGTAAWAKNSAPDRPTAAEIQTWCDTEEQGAHQLSDELRRRQRELDGRESAIAAKESEMAAAEARLKTRLDALDAARTELTALFERADLAREARVDGLVKMVEAGRPSTVAPMFGRLEDELAVDVLDRMSRKKAGKLLIALDPAKAAALAAKMAEPVAVEMP